MNFGAFRGTTLRQVIDFTKDLAVGLTKLSFEDNFQSFTVDVVCSVGATTDIEISNGIRGGQIPTHFVVEDSDGPVLLHRGAGTWTTSTLFVRNSLGANGTTATVRFIR